MEFVVLTLAKNLRLARRVAVTPCARRLPLLMANMAMHQRAKGLLQIYQMAECAGLGHGSLYLILAGVFVAVVWDYLYTRETLDVGYHVLYTRTCWTEYDTNGFLFMQLDAS